MMTSIAFASAVLATAIQGEPADLTCETASAVVYFEAGSTELNSFATAAITDVARRSKGCRIDGIEIHVPAYNISDNAEREHAVLIALNDAGLMARPGTVSTAFTEMTSPAEQATPAARRISVDIALTPRAIG